MKLGLYANGRKKFSFEQMLEFAAATGIEMVELACGEESGFAHCVPKELLADEGKLQEFKDMLAKYGLGISALSCHGNPISPNKDIAALSDESMRNAVLLAEKLGLDTICCFSGCPGDHPGAKYSNWVTLAWPLDYSEVYKWQWEEVLIPYWTDFAAFARAHGVGKIALELHPGQMCYNPASLKKLRAAVGDEIGVNLDFSHLLWQGMEPIAVIDELAGCIYHMHGKDIGFDRQKVRENGLINTSFFHKRAERSWNFRTVGYGHDAFFWKNIMARLERVGYDNVVSIEAECEIFDRKQAIRKAAAFLKDIMVRPSDEATWIEDVRRSREPETQA